MEPPVDFLADREYRPLKIEGLRNLRTKGLLLGKGPNALEVVVTESEGRPSAADLRAAWRSRLSGRATPLLLVALYSAASSPRGDNHRVALCGPAGDETVVYQDLDPLRVERICASALDELDRHAALRLLLSVLPDVEAPVLGLHNEGFFATHELHAGVPARSDWARSTIRGAAITEKRSRDLLSALGFTVEQHPGSVSILRTAGTKVAVALLLERGESPDAAGPLFSGVSPIAYAMAKADEERVRYVLVLTGPMLRLYPTGTTVGTGRRGRTETFVELHLDLLPANQAGYLWLLFSPDALRDGGTVEEILEQSKDYAADLGERLRDRIHTHVIPDLATGLMAARRLRSPSVTDLATTYQMALTLLFRLLFVAYAEDKGLLPYRTNELYRARSLKQKAHELLSIARANTSFSKGTTHWEEVQRLFRAVDKGMREWGVPEYNGGLFSSSPTVSPVSAVLDTLSLDNMVLGPVLTELLLDQTDEGRGPVDFRSLGVREFGTIYEGLLVNELSVAEMDLTLIDGEYRPARKSTDPVTVRKGSVYLHTASGARKTTGSFFTKQFAVEHLLDDALEPALADHLGRLGELDDRAAAEAFFDFRVADVAMGSGHFLVATVDRIERRLGGYLAHRTLPSVTAELAHLRAEAQKALAAVGTETEIDDVQLLRRQIARRCVYGVDLNPLAVELARLSLWIHTFVPGLPLSFLDHNLVQGNSLVGIGRLDEIQEALEGESLPLFPIDAEHLLGQATEPLKRLAKIADATPADLAQARRARAAAMTAVAPAAALCDIVLACRIAGQRVQVDIKRWEAIRDTLSSSPAHLQAQERLAGLQALHFPVAFAEVFLRGRPGFDVIVGNPPWEKVRVEEHEFWARHAPGLRGLRTAQRNQLMARLRRERPDLVALLDRERATSERMRDAVRSLPGMNTGHPDLFRAFTWRFGQLAATSGGRIGVVLPGDAFKIAGATDVREGLALACSDIWPQMLTNKGKWVFDDVHSQKMIALVTAVVNGTRETTAFHLTAEFHDRGAWDRRDPNDSVVVALDTLRAYSPTLVVPLLPSTRSLAVIKEFMRSPALIAHPSLQVRRVYADFETSRDRAYWHATKARGDWPVYTGESFDIWQPDTGRYYAFTNGRAILEVAHTKWNRAPRTSAYANLPPAWRATKDHHPANSARIAFRHVTNRTNTRTFIVALIPPQVVTVEKAPWVLWLDPAHSKKDEAYLLGIMSSLPLDWWCRRFIEGTADQEAFNCLRIPDGGQEPALARRATQLAGRLACQDPRFAEWAREVGVDCGVLQPDERMEMIHELDALVAHLYELGEDHLCHIFETFHEGWDYRERLQATLKHYTAWRARR